MNPITISDSPRIISVEAFLSPEEMEHLRLMGTPTLTRSKVADPKTGEGIAIDYRTGQTSCFAKKQDLIVTEIEERIAKLAGVRAAQIEYLQLNKYEIGDEFKEHQDWFGENAPGHAAQIAMGGQRIMSAIIYLNVPEGGGETVFTKIKETIKPETGKLVLWMNVNKDVKPDPRVMHLASPVTKGEKWTITTWIRERAFDGSEEAAHAALKAQATSDVQGLKAKLLELHKQNEEEGYQEILEVCRRRKLVLFPYPEIQPDGRLGAGLDLRPMPEGKQP